MSSVKFVKRKKMPLRGDCVVRAFSYYFKWDYEFAKERMEVLCPNPVDDGVPVDRIQVVAASFGLVEVEFRAPVPVVVVAERFQDALIYIDQPSPHVTAAVGGKIHDTWDSRYYEDSDGYKFLMTARKAWITAHPIERRAKCKRK